MYPIIKYDKEILRDVIINLNKFLKHYYTNVANDKPLLYKHIKHNQIHLQRLEDLRNTIMDDLANLIYVLKKKDYYNDINIPEKSEFIREYLNEKIHLLGYKLKMKPTQLTGVSL
jgi:hypothetical protein